MKAIINGKIILDDTILNGYTLLFDKKILSLSRSEPPEDCEMIDADGSYVSAGFVDMHIHGSGGADIMDAKPEALETISSTIMESGTTSFVATTMTMSREKILSAIENVIENGQNVSGAKIRGIHLEGPFISRSKGGAQDISYIEEPDYDWISPYLDHIAVITIAPELRGAREFISKIALLHPHIITSIGHSEADYETAMKSFGWGISHATHLFNAMTPWNHRSPGIVGAVFDSDVSAEIIADLIHLHPSILRTVYRLKDDKVILVTDAMRAGCMKSGMYELGGQKVIVSEGKASLESGVLAGSVLQLNKAVRNYNLHTEATLAKAVYAATAFPAQRLGLSCGTLKKGYDADIILFDDNIIIKSVYIDGMLKYQSDRE